MEKKREPKLVVKSKYNYLYEFLDRNGITALILFILLIISAKQSLISAYLIIIGIYVIFLILSTIYYKLKYNANVYKFYEDKIIYTDSFFNKQTKRIKYEDIKEVRLNQTFLQMLFKIGTVVITTNSNNFFNNTILIHGVTNINETYKEIKLILENC